MLECIEQSMCENMKIPLLSNAPHARQCVNEEETNSCSRFINNIEAPENARLFL